MVGCTAGWSNGKDCAAQGKPRPHCGPCETYAALVEALRDCTDWMRSNLTDSDLSGIEAYKQARAALALAEDK